MTTVGSVERTVDGGTWTIDEIITVPPPLAANWSLGSTGTAVVSAPLVTNILFGLTVIDVVQTMVLFPSELMVVVSVRALVAILAKLVFVAVMQSIVTFEETNFVPFEPIGVIVAYAVAVLLESTAVVSLLSTVEPTDVIGKQEIPVVESTVGDVVQSAVVPSESKSTLVIALQLRAAFESAVVIVKRFKLRALVISTNWTDIVITRSIAAAFFWLVVNMLVVVATYSEIASSFHSTIVNCK